MRQKINTDNSLRSGCSFCYWDIFSGLSNENLGSALYSCLALQATAVSFPQFGYASSFPALFTPVHHWYKNTAPFYNSLAAPKYTAMTSTQTNPVSAGAYYRPLLERYALRLVKDATAAAHLVTQVLNDQYDLDKQVPSAQLRKTLQRDLRHLCFYWEQSQIFDRPVIKVPYRQETQPPLFLNNNETTR